jgi:hypothetical protein
MKIKLNPAQFKFLISSLPEELEVVIPNLEISKGEEHVVINLESKVAETLRNWVIDELQRIGYDKMYQLNAEGFILQELKDSLLQK